MKIEFTPGAVADLAALPARVASQIVRKIERLQFGLVGDVKRLKHAVAGYRLRSGDYRILFDVKPNTIVVQKIKNRKEAYD